MVNKPIYKLYDQKLNFMVNFKSFDLIENYDLRNSY